MCASAEQGLASLSDSCHVVAKAKERLQTAPYPTVQNVSCQYDDGALFLRGEVPSSSISSLRRRRCSNLKE